MPKASKADITFYKGVILVKIHDKVVSDGAYMSIYELDNLLKAHADLTDVSCSEMSVKQMQQLKHWSKDFAEQIGLDFDKDQRLDLDFNRKPENK